MDDDKKDDGWDKRQHDMKWGQILVGGIIVLVLLWMAAAHYHEPAGVDPYQGCSYADGSQC